MKSVPVGVLDAVNRFHYFCLIFANVRLENNLILFKLIHPN